MTDHQTTQQTTGPRSRRRMLVPLVLGAAVSTSALTGCELGADSADERAQDACRAIIEKTYAEYTVDDLTSRDQRDGVVEVYADLSSGTDDVDLLCRAREDDGEWLAGPDDLEERD